MKRVKLQNWRGSLERRLETLEKYRMQIQKELPQIASPIAVGENQRWSSFSIRSILSTISQIFSTPFAERAFNLRYKNIRCFCYQSRTPTMGPTKWPPNNDPEIHATNSQLRLCPQKKFQVDRFATFKVATQDHSSLEKGSASRLHCLFCDWSLKTITRFQFAIKQSECVKMNTSSWRREISKNSQRWVVCLEDIIEE